MAAASRADEIFDLQPSWVKGSISRRDARFLHARAVKAAVDTVVEIGTAAGVSTAVLCDAVGTGAVDYTVATYDIASTYYGDQSRQTGDATPEMLAGEQLAHVEFRNPATALDAREDYPADSLGFAFIDAAHKHPWPSLDLLALLPCLRPGAEVVLHDINLPLVNSDWQAWGVKHLYDQLDVEKQVDSDSTPPNIGSIVVSADKEGLRRQVLEVISSNEYEVEVAEDAVAACVEQ
jgi:predicted O-methyltransferase YrrM